MNTEYPISEPLQKLIRHTEDMLDTTIILKRQRDGHHDGYLMDTFLNASEQNIILFPETTLGTLKDFIIAKHCIKLLLIGTSHRSGHGKELVFDEKSATIGMEQIYRDLLKDDRVRSLELPVKKKIIPDLFFLFHGMLTDLPSTISAQILISKRCAALRNAQVYSLVNESMLDMHALDSATEQIPQRYFVMHQGMYYARDMILSYMLSLNKLHPEINIPELQAFRNLNVQQMVTCRWSQSHWAHTKVVGEAMANLMKIALSMDFDRRSDERFYQDLSQCIVLATHRWMTLMSMQDWYIWESAEHYRRSMENKENISRISLEKIFSE
jgi:hypothetical protein